MARCKLLLIDTIHPSFEALLGDGYEITDGTKWSRLETISRIGEFNGILIRSRFRIDSEILTKAASLSFIARAGAGMENIDTAYAASKGIACIHAAEGNRDAVGEHALAMLLALFNNLVSADGEVKRGVWKREENRGVELQGKTIGVIGYGNMGTAFVKKLSGFDVTVLIYDKYRDFSDGTYFRKAGMDKIYSQSDVISLHIPLTDETNYLVNDAFINRFRKNFYLVNTSRGMNVNTSDLVKNMKLGKIAGAALDVLEYEAFSFEAIAADSLPEPFMYLASSPQVVLSPHIAGWTHESNLKIAKILAEKIKAIGI